MIHRESQSISMMRLSFPWWWQAQASDGYGCDYTSLSFCAENKSHTKNSNQHAAQDYTTLRCCMSPFSARGEKELLMHLIRRPLESRSSYHYPCPFRRRLQSRQFSGWANLNLLRHMLFAFSGRLQLVGRTELLCGYEEQETVQARLV